MVVGKMVKGRLLFKIDKEYMEMLFRVSKSAKMKEQKIKERNRSVKKIYNGGYFVENRTLCHREKVGVLNKIARNLRETGKYIPGVSIQLTFSLRTKVTKYEYFQI